MAMVCGCDDAEAMNVWGEANAGWLDEILELPHSTPTQDVFLSVFAALDPCRDLGWMMTADRWAGLAFVVKVTRERTVLTTNKTSVETAYYIGSNQQADAAGAAHHIRRHWSVENELHWVLDMAFREDEARHRARHLAENLTTLRHFSLNLLKRDPDRRLGVANSRRRAGWDHEYLLRVLTSEGR